MNLVNFNPLALGSTAGRGVLEGQIAGGSLNTNPVVEMFQRKGVMLSPQEQTELQQKMAESSSRQQRDISERQMGVVAGLGNQVANLNTQRQMALNAQQLAAQNTANQLANLSNARNTASNTLTSAGNIAASLFR